MYKPYFERLKNIYAAMDREYDAVSSRYGFQCSGCAESCCLTRFFHHTFIESFYLLEGFSGLEEGAREAFRREAAEVERRAALHDSGEGSFKMMCPLNAGGLCALYEYRPMICRMHGIPHELRRPGQEVFYGPGCQAGSDLFEEKGYLPFDRTPFYMEMAGLEKEFREAFRLKGKVKKTVAGMVL